MHRSPNKFSFPFTRRNRLPSAGNRGCARKCCQTPPNTCPHRSMPRRTRTDPPRRSGSLLPTRIYRTAWSRPPRCWHSRPPPKKDGRRNEGKMVARELVVSRKDAIKMSDAIEETVDGALSSVQLAATATPDLSIRTCRADNLGARGEFSKAAKRSTCRPSPRSCAGARPIRTRTLGRFARR